MLTTTLGPILHVLLSCSAYAETSICAQVKIQILQQLTLERQAFQATMIINNGVAGVALNNLNVAVTFTDQTGNAVRGTSDPNDLTASFFVRLQDGSSVPPTIPGGASSTINWLIIPAPGAAGQNPQGQLYSVGATLSYISGGVSNVVQVLPATISVLPLPSLTLDYFLPAEVYGDDPFTDAVEPPVPFSLGLRVKNTGYGVANNLAIQSAQPRIVDNKQGLLVSFRLLSGEVNGQPASPTLLCNLGNVQPNTSGIARWIMTCSLSGQFVSFSATYSHSDDLGGQLTSLIATNPQTHTLVHDVLVDLPGRDAIRDFLAQDGNFLRVYESQNVDTLVTDQSVGAAISRNGSSCTVKAGPAPGFSFIKFTDPFSGGMALLSATRGDGKLLNPANTWLSQTQDKTTHQWSYFVNVFDANNTAGLPYNLAFGPQAGQSNRPPVLDPIPDHVVPAGQFLSFNLTASDPGGNGLQYALSGTVAEGAALDGSTGLFTWRPKDDQVGTNLFNLTVTDNGQPPASATGSFRVIVTGLGPMITNQPTNLVLVAGAVATFNVGAAGMPPLGFQWSFNSNNIPNATNSALVLTNLFIEQAGTYAVLVTNQHGSTISSNAQLNVQLVPLTLGTTQDKPVSASVSKLLANNRTHANYALSLLNMDTTSTYGGTIALSNGVLTYSPPPGYLGLDSFNYSVTNGHGASATGEAVVSITSTNAPSANQVVSITAAGNGWLLLFSGIPGRSYVLQSAPAATGPWTDLSGPVLASATGLLVFTDYINPEPSMRFYRIRPAP